MSNKIKILIALVALFSVLLDKIVIAQRKSDGIFCCSCPGWIRARNGHSNRICKHIKILQPLLEKTTNKNRLNL